MSKAQRGADGKVTCYKHGDVTAVRFRFEAKSSEATTEGDAPLKFLGCVHCILEALFPVYFSSAAPTDQPGGDYVTADGKVPEAGDAVYWKPPEPPRCECCKAPLPTGENPEP